MLKSKKKHTNQITIRLHRDDYILLQALKKLFKHHFKRSYSFSYLIRILAAKELVTWKFRIREGHILELVWPHEVEAAVGRFVEATRSKADSPS